MKRFLKIAGFVFIIILALLIVLPYAFKDKIVLFAKTELNKKLNAHVTFRDVNLSLIKGFPNVFIGIENLSITGIKPFEGDTLVAFRSFGLKVDLISLLKMKDIKVLSIIIDRPVINALVLKNGKANWDIMKPSGPETPSDTSKSSTKLVIKLKRFSLKEAKILYKDESMGIISELKGLNFNLSGDFSSDLTKIKIESTAHYFNFIYGSVKYINQAAVKFHAKIDANLQNNTFTFLDNELKLNDIGLRVDGKITMPAKAINCNLKFISTGTDFKSVLSMIPAIYINNFKGLQASGTMNITGNVNGDYIGSIMPSVNLDIVIKNGTFKYPELPSSVDDVNAEMHLFYDGKHPDNSTVTIDRFHLVLAQSPFDAQLSIKTPVSDPDVTGKIEGKVDLSNILKVVHLDSTDLSGIIESDINFSGKMSSVQKKLYDDLMAEGAITIDDLKYKGPKFRIGLAIQKSRLIFSPQYLDLQSFDINMGKSDIQFSGKITDFMSYIFLKGVLKADFNLNSKYFDANEILSGIPSDTTKKGSDTTHLSVIRVPARIEVSFAASMDRILYSKMDISNIKGLILVADEKASLVNLNMNMLDGSIMINGDYNSSDFKKPLIDVDLDIQNIDINSTYKAFSTVKQLAPIAGNTMGKISSTLSFRSQLDKHMIPIYNTTNGKGTLSTEKIEIYNSKTFGKLAEKMKSKKLRHLTLRDINLSFTMKDGRIKVNPFAAKFGSGKITAGGEQGIDQSLNYNMVISVPRNELGDANEALQGLASEANSNGLKINSSDNVNMAVNVKGTFSNPEVTPDLSQLGTNSMQSLKSAAKENADTKASEINQNAKQKASDKLLEDANNQAQNVRDVAQKSADEVRQKANENADKLEKEAESKPKFLQSAAKKGAEKIRNQGEDKAQKIIKEADDKANGIITNAKAEVEKMK
jgi:AsmA-like C-terminal region